MSRYRVVWLALTALGCHGVTDPESGPFGSWALVSVDGASLPMQWAPVPPKGPPGGLAEQCFLVLSGGHLDLGPPAQSFLFQRSFADSCTGSLLSTATESGVFQRDGRRLELRQEEHHPQYPGQVTRLLHKGTIAGERISLVWEDRAYDFERLPD